MTFRAPAFADATSYRAAWDRLALEAALQQGVLGAGDLKVTAAAAGGMRVDVAAGVALVKGTNGVPVAGLSHGLHYALNDASIPSAGTLAASSSSNPRIDVIALRIRDSRDLGDTADDATIVVLTGTATNGATLDNMSGAPALPADHMRLADVLVPTSSTAVAAGNIRDRRPWARGINFIVVAVAGDIGLNNAAQTQLFGNRAEVSGGNVVDVGVVAQINRPSGVYVNAAAVVDAVGSTLIIGSDLPTATREIGHSGSVPTIPNTGTQLTSTGSHLFAATFFASGAGAIVRATNSIPLVFSVRERVVQNASQ